MGCCWGSCKQNKEYAVKAINYEHKESLLNLGRAESRHRVDRSPLTPPTPKTPVGLNSPPKQKTPYQPHQTSRKEAPQQLQRRRTPGADRPSRPARLLLPPTAQLWPTWKLWAGSKGSSGFLVLRIQPDRRSSRLTIAFNDSCLTFWPRLVSLRFVFVSPAGQL